MYLEHADLSKYYAVDIEADNLLPGVTRVWCAVAQNIETSEVTKLIGHEQIKQWFDGLDQDTYIVGHNFLSYDAPVLHRILGIVLGLDRIVDTLVLSYLYHPKLPRPQGLKGNEGPHSLKAWALRRGGTLKVEHEDWSQFSDEMLHRCVVDTDLTAWVFRSLTGRMRKLGFSEQSCKVEHCVRAVVDKQERTGFYFDLPAARSLLSKLRGIENDLSATVLELFPPTLEPVATYKYRVKQDGQPTQSYSNHAEKYPELRFNADGTYTTYDYKSFNLGSPTQRVQRLLSLGWKPTKFTKKTKKGGGGNPQVDEDSLLEFSESTNNPAIKALADWVVVNSRANMLNGWLGHVQADSRIHGRVLSCGAMSRRMSHNSPATAAIVGNEAPYGEACRALWTVEDKKTRVLVGIDAKAIQMRCFAHLLPDPSKGQRYYDEELCPDPHQENADLIGIKRKPVKNVFYANLFGAFPPKLAVTAGFSGTKAYLEERGLWVQNEMYRVTPGLKEATEDAKLEFRRNNGFMKCPDGGLVRCESESAALNYRIQPAEACIMKVGLILLDDIIVRKGWDVFQNGNIHDEWQYDCPENLGEEFGITAANCIRDAGEELKFRVPMAGDYKIGKTWAETH